MKIVDNDYLRAVFPFITQDGESKPDSDVVLIDGDGTIKLLLTDKVMGAEAARLLGEALLRASEMAGMGREGR